jgi:predicted metal-dependent hydrolase
MRCASGYGGGGVQRHQEYSLQRHPPEGKIRISASLHINIDTILVFAITKLAWITQQEKKVKRTTPRNAP